jgi:uncharacterized membrane protein YjdF
MPTGNESLRRPTALLAVFAAIWLLLAIHPWYRQDWLLENLLVFAAVPIFVATARRLRFSDFAYSCLFLFLVLHSVGAHYTYSEVPYDRAFEQLTGRTLNDLLGWERNHYDRVVHFAYGLLITPLALELYRAVAPPRGVWRWLMPLLFMVSHSRDLRADRVGRSDGVRWRTRGRLPRYAGGRLGRAEGHGPGGGRIGPGDPRRGPRGALPGTPARLPRHRPEGSP